MTKVELEMDANAFPFQALVELKDTMKFRLWQPRKPSKSEGSGPSGEKLHPIALSIKLIPWKLLSTSRARGANLSGKRTNALSRSFAILCSNP
jgi:hypothetical protein